MVVMSHVPGAALRADKVRTHKALPWWWWCSLWPFPSFSLSLSHSLFSHTERLHSALQPHNSGDPSRVVPLGVLSRVCFVLLCTFGLQQSLPLCLFPSSHIIAFSLCLRTFMQATEDHYGDADAARRRFHWEESVLLLSCTD